MFIAMNRFRIAPGREKDFIEIWKTRDTHLSKVPGFIKFQLLQGETSDEYTLFASHSVWESSEVFYDWTRSEAFRQAHANAGDTKGMYLGPPNLEVFEVVV